MSTRFRLLHVLLPVPSGPGALIAWQEGARVLGFLFGVACGALVLAGAMQIGPRVKGGAS